MKKKKKPRQPQTTPFNNLDAIRERRCCAQCWSCWGGGSIVGQYAITNAHFCDHCLEIVLGSRDALS